MRMSPYMVGLIAMTAAACSTTLESGLTESQADAVVVALHAQGIGAEKEARGGADGGFDVRVTRDDVGAALHVLREAGLPSAPEPGLRDLFGGGALVPTATEERARYAAGVSGELAASLERIEGIVDARVHVAVPERRLRRSLEEPERPRASVLLKRRASAAPIDEAAVRALVAGAVENMRAEDVTVMTVEAPPVSDVQRGLVQLGPVSVTRGSAPALRGILAVSLGVIAALGLVLAWLVRRSRRAIERLESKLLELEAVPTE